ncbi:MAG TPA: helix-turn-helix domain-containing protein [Allosphingosinicella sp.]
MHPGLNAGTRHATFAPQMQLNIDNESLVANSRLTAIRLALLTSRSMENWRQGVGDNGSAMILLAVIAICGERLTRTELPEALRNVGTPLPPGFAAECNVSSIAAATGLNRETTRRKVNALVEQGYLARSEEGEISFPTERQQDPATLDFVRKQLEAVVRLANDAIRDGVLTAV